MEFAKIAAWSDGFGEYEARNESKPQVLDRIRAPRGPDRGGGFVCSEQLGVRARMQFLSYPPPPITLIWIFCHGSLDEVSEVRGTAGFSRRRLCWRSVHDRGGLSPHMRPPLLDLRSAAPLPPPRHWPRPRRRRLTDMNCCRCSSALGGSGGSHHRRARSDGDVTARDFFYESAQIHRKFDQTAREFYHTSWKSSQTAKEIRTDRHEIPPDCAGNSTRLCWKFHQIVLEFPVEIPPDCA